MPEPDPAVVERAPPSRRPAAPIGRGQGAGFFAVLVVVGAVCGASALGDGLYDFSAWGPVTLAVLALLLGLVLGRPPIPRGPAAVAIGGLLFLAVWSWISTGWAESEAQVIVESSRWVLYAAALALLLLLLRDERFSWALIGSATAAAAVVALYVIATMLWGDGPSLFVAGRLFEPIGYVNGQAGYFLISFWPLIALAEQTRYRVLSGVALGLAVVLGALLILSQTRAVLPSLVVSTAAMVLFVPGRTRRLWVLVVVATGVALASGQLLDVYDEAGSPGRGGLPTEDTLQSAAGLTLLVAALLGAAWALVQTLASELAGRRAELARTLSGVATGAVLLVILVGAAVVAAAVDDPVGKVERQYDAFVNLETQTTEQSRFLSGGGTRYDYWRIAVDQARDHPLRGIGAGNYDRTYFLERRTTEDVTQPHSIELQTLAELGLIGGLGLLAFLASVLIGFGRQALSARSSLAARGLAVAAGGAFIAWLAHTSVDWLHVIPGVTGIALCAAAVLLAPWVRNGARSVRRPLGIALAGACALVIVIAAVAVGRPALAEHLRLDARDELAGDPREALRLANRSLELNDQSVATRFVKAAAYARLNRYRDTRATLLQATRLEPHNFVPWGLLGDVEVRRGDLAEARRNYRRALRLNPRDAALKRLVEDPRLALTDPASG